ncbi:MAG: putative NADH dehydrogenase/NAD(P)H nitroreductase [Paracoccaceae bacterium]|nr:MAG: putative NADH dehydrogenase/NAD(P)H nitroreductase [Paracoccaceae bacterium]
MTALEGEALSRARAEAQAAHRAPKARLPARDADTIDLILTGARSHHAWTDRPVPVSLLKRIYEIAAAGPTSMNSSPARFVFVTSPEGRARLAKAPKAPEMMGAPVTVIVAHDLEFWRALPYLIPHKDRRPRFKGKPALAETTAFRNGTLRRAIGLDVGTMSGFSKKIVDREFFAGTTLRSNVLISLGCADESAPFQRLPRLPVERACTFA